MISPTRAALVCASLAAMFVGGMPASAAEQQKAAPAKAAAKLGEQLPMKEFMAHVVAYSAHNVWSKQGWVTDQAGHRSLFPKNDEEWEEAEGAALTLGELMELLLLPSRRVNVPGWDSSALEVRRLARLAAAAAEKQDPTAFFRIGTDIDGACESCHRAVGIVQ